MSVQSRPWGQLKSGEPVQQITLTNANQIMAKILTYGGILAELHAPDKDGKNANVCLTYPDLDGFEKDTFFIGATVGRFANRIAKGHFELNGKSYSLAINDGPNHLHGGPTGYFARVWDAEPFEKSGECGVILTYTSADGEEGYPGTVNVKVMYTLTDQDELRIDYEATTDQATPINLTNHTYWNLAGKGTVHDHVLKLHCSRFLAVDDTAIPTGELAPVAETPAMDFTNPKPVGKDLDAAPGGGYDHCFVIDDSNGPLAPAAKLTDPASGRVMEVLTTKPGIQFYSGNFLEGQFVKHGALCLETQFFPDAPNQPEFPSCILNPGEVYKHTTVHRFTVEK